ncbi:MAG: hypothetical protein BMS9Abin31_0043 [Gammaproteobacteria bacterium]|nr:MAG: hypothetical protein BMS9Abin31_0043 [Gammaproteobacteria bacterium]
MTIHKTQNFNKVPSPYAFWIGLPLMLLFVAAGIGGGSWALDRIFLEDTLYKNGEVIQGIVFEKKKIEGARHSDSLRTTIYEVSYSFEIGSRSIIKSDVRIEGQRFSFLKKGEAIDIRYLPSNPYKNLPDGSRLSNLFTFFAIFGFIIGLGALVVAVGMIVDRVRKR